MAARTRVKRVNTTGAAGSATGSVSFAARPGVLSALDKDWHAAAPATSDVVITESWDGGSQILYTKSDSAADNAVPPIAAAGDNTGAAIAGQYLPVALRGGLITISVTGCDPLTDALLVTFSVLD